MTETAARIEYGRCHRCGYRMLPVPAMSPCGHPGPVAVEPLSEPGTVYSWTRVRLSDDTRLMVMVDFFGGDLRVTAPLEGVDAVQIDDQVWLQRTDADAPPYVFRKA